MGLCIYCQTNPATERDHLTLRGLYSKPRPSNLITVPACKACNAGFAPDDNYFLGLALEWGASACDDGKAVAGSRLRSMQRDKDRSLWKPLFATLEPVEVLSPGGVFLGKSLEFGLDTERLERTVKRMIRGLYYHATQKHLPPGDFVRAMPFAHFVEQQSEEDKTPLAAWFASLPSEFIGDAFAYRYSVLDEAQHISFWNLLFYRRIEFTGITGKQEPIEIGAGAICHK